MNVKIILADDHEIMRQGLRSLLENQADLKIVAEAGNGRECVKLTKKLKPDLVIMDISMPDLNGIEATEQIKKEAPGTKVIALSMHPDKGFVDRILKAGASGYLLKDCSFEEMLEGIKTVISNKTYLCNEISETIIKSYVGHLPEKRPALTPREREVLQLIAEGKSTKETASLLNVSVKTVETHRKQIMDKLRIHSVAELTKYAIRHGITALEK